MSAASAATTAAVGCLDACLKQQSCSRSSGSQSKEAVNQAAVAVGVQPVLADTKAAAKGVDRKATANEALQGKVMPTNMIRSFFGRSPLRKAPMSNF